MKNKFVIALAVHVSATLSGSAFAAQINLCNYTGENIWAVRAEHTGGNQFRTVGYFQVNNNSCSLNVSETNNTRYYYYAVSQSGKEYGGGYSFCTVPNSGFTLESAQNTGNCPSTAKPFFCRWTADSAVDEVVFTPGGNGLHESRCDI